jgi:hypothetical protein
VEETLYFFWIVFVIWKQLIKDNTPKRKKLINHEKLSDNHFCKPFKCNKEIISPNYVQLT